MSMYPSENALPADGQTCTICQEIGHAVCVDVTDIEVAMYQVAQEEIAAMVAAVRRKRRVRRVAVLSVVLVAYCLWRRR